MLFFWTVYSLKNLEESIKVSSKTETVILNCTNISQYYCFYYIFNKINAPFVSERDFILFKIIIITYIFFSLFCYYCSYFVTVYVKLYHVFMESQHGINTGRAFHSRAEFSVTQRPP